jgi:hypothetical protein
MRQRIPFQKGVKIVAAIRYEKDEKEIFVEQRVSRTLEDYTRWVKATFPKDGKGASAAIRKIKEEGFDEIEIFTFRDALQNWKKEEKTHQAKKSRSMRKTDKRRGARSQRLRL